ncbi:type II secretion system F family protein [Anaerocolumna xylanovorans]|uniref:type II secretion system F family protein n=1 Tax=Anaerocolumna xylanovorans TaxID=100134 RepID=UPI0015881082|nr:type II secretion system protein F [Anaerocolumna xylanovorans]
MNTEFKDALLSLIAALNTGYSIENAFHQALIDLRQMYGEGSLIIPEFETIVNKIYMNQNTEDILSDLGERSDVEDIKNFAEVFRTAKRTGGDSIRIMRSTEKTISEKIEVEREIQTLISGKRLEAKIMNIMPCGIICYFRISSPGFLDPLYGNFLGVFIMTAVLAVYYGIIRVTKRLTDIRV